MKIYPVKLLCFKLRRPDLINKSMFNTLLFHKHFWQFIFHKHSMQYIYIWNFAKLMDIDLR